jgi:hypothetical protein
MEQRYNSNYSDEDYLEDRSKVTMFDAWVDALTSPNKETYTELGKAENASLINAAMWILLATLIGGVISAILSSIFGTTDFVDLTNQLSESGIELPVSQVGASAVLIGVICGAPLGAIGSTISFVIGALITNWIANLFGGKGTLESFAFVTAAYTAPITLVTNIVAPVPFVGVPLAGLFGFYAFILSLITLRGVKELSWIKTILVILVPVILVGIFFGCIMLVFGSAAIAAFQNGTY